MTEQEKIDYFNQDLENLLKGEPSESKTTDAERVNTARQLAAADFSAHSRARETTRVRLLARANRELPVQNKRKEMNTKFSNVFRTLAFGAFLLMIVFGLGWVLSNTTPQLGVGLEGTPAAEPVIVPEESVIAFPRQPAGWDSMAALMNGRLVLVDGCLRMEDAFSDTNSLVIWPHDYNWQMTEGIVEVLDGTGQVVARVGEEISIGGGEAYSLVGLGNNTNNTGEALQNEIPASCPGPYWLVGFGEIQLVDAETKVSRVVGAFGTTLQNVSLLSPTVVQEIQDNYTPYVAPELLATWINAPSTAPGRRVSSPWPVGIEFSTVTQQSPTEYSVTGNIVEVTGEEVMNGGRANEIPVQITVNEIQGTWMITSFVQDGNISSSPTPLTLDADSETIRQRLIDSQTNWTSIWVDAVITRNEGNIISITRAQIWFVDPDKSREIYDFDNDNLADSFVFTQNVLQTIFDLKTGEETTQILDSVSRPPLTILDPGYSFAQSGTQSSGGTFQPTGTDIIAGRETLIVEWTDDAGQLKDRLWIDVYTGVVLKWENLREGHKEVMDGQEVLMDAGIEVLYITYNEIFSDDLFTPHVPDEPMYMDYSQIPIISPAQSPLSFKWVFNEDGSAPDIYIADVYAGDQWLGRADFGEIPGGSCDRSWNGGLIVLNYVQGDLATLRWFSLKDVTMFRDVPGYDLHSPATFAPNDFRVAFVGCKEDDCGIFVKDLEFDGAVIKLSDGETATAPVWSPNGEYVIIWYGEPINERGITNIKVVHAETGEVLYMGDPTLDASPLQAWDMPFMYKPFTSTQRCEAPPETISSGPILPSPDGTYTVQQGDTLAGIANQFGLAIETLLSLNGLTADSILVVGQVLVVAPPIPN